MMAVLKSEQLALGVSSQSRLDIALVENGFPVGGILGVMVVSVVFETVIVVGGRIVVVVICQNGVNAVRLSS